ncbi:MAG: NrpR regulatory domain-containing protein [Dehalococcoidales bacterium]|nr:NrpR regulatory domain-containing protein [Dehalococcoidales bacterium]
MGFETQDVERKTIVIMKILKDSPEPLGARVVAQRLKDYGIELGERAVRYHLQLMDERGFTRLLGRRDGRVLTEQGIEEVNNALVKDKVGFAVSRIELLAFRTTFNPDVLSGLIPVNISFFPKARFKHAIDAMRPAFEGGICVSNLVATASEGEAMGGLVIPKGKTGLATVCSIAINGTLLKAGIPMTSRFSGILQIRNNKPLRFVELIEYAGCSLDPSEAFIRARMTSVREVALTGHGRILATYREIPAICRPITEEVMTKLKSAGVAGLLAIGNPSEPVCEIGVELNRIGIILFNGLNPVAAAVEAGIEVENHGMSTLMEYQQLKKFEEL